MSRTITALFDTRADADAGRARLLAADVDADNVRIHDQASASADQTSMSQSSTETSSREYATADNNDRSTGEDIGMWASIKNAFLPDEDRHTYEEGVRRGGFLLSADVDEDEIDKAIAALEDSNSIDIDERSASWKNEGWTAPTSATRPAMFGNDRMEDDSDAMPRMGEQLTAGKREIERGGTRTRSYVSETPLHEQIRSRQEKAGADRAMSDGERMGSSSMHNDTGSGIGTKAAGLGDEAMGNIKQGLGSLTGNEDLKRAGEAQERSGEMRQGGMNDDTTERKY